MKKKIGLSLLSILCVFSTFGAGKWILQGKEYRVDTLFHTYIGPGTTQTSLKLSGAGSLRIFYTTTDLANPYVTPRVIMANDKVTGVATVSSMATSHSTSGSLYFAGVNADFFGNSAPIGTTIVDGEIYNTTNGNGWDSFGIDKSNVPYFGVPTVTGTVQSPNAGTSVLSSVNTQRSENYLTLYSKRFGAATGTNIYGTEVGVMLVEGETFETSKTIRMKVIAAPVKGVGSMTVPANGYVLSGNGTSSTFLDKMVLGEEFTITTKVAFNNATAGDITQIVGGCPMIVSDGKVLNTEGAIDHLVALNPRTAVGYTSDKTKLVMLVVDGRSTISIGVVSKVLADIMINTGCSEAMNFDGGGSTALYVKELGIRNVPSDGKERAVTNGLYLATSTPEDKEIAQILFTDVSKRLPKYGYYSPKFYGYNKYGVLVSTNVEGAILSCTAELGQVQEGGKTLFCNGEGSHALTATYNGISATIPVEIANGEVSFRLNSAIDDTYQGYKVEVESTINEETMPLDNQALTWWSDDSNIATVDERGIVKGVSNGETIIRGKVDAFEGAIKIIVEKPIARVMAIEPNLDPPTWIISQTGGDKIKAEPMENGMKITYTGNSSSRGANIKLAKRIKVWSLPDAIRLRINPGDAPIKNIKISTSANEGGVISTELGALVANQINELDLPTDKWCDTKDMDNYPIYINNIYFGMGASTVGTEYTIEIPGIEAVYLNAPSSVNSVLGNENSISLYPNPVNLGESVTIKLAETGSAQMRVYNEAGQLMLTKDSIDENNISFSTSTLEKGIFFVTIKQNSSVQSMKLVVK